MKRFKDFVKEECQRIDEHIEKRGDNWVVLNSSRTKVLGTHGSRKKALAQLRAIEANK